MVINWDKWTFGFLGGLMLLLVGCDTTAMSDMRDTEKVLKEADRWHAEQWAEPEYRKAQAALVEAMDLQKVRYINEARDKAAEAKMWAEEAVDLAKIRYADMEKEKDRLGAYKP